MPWIQYTRNFEDVILCRALQGIEHGCFLDVGSSNPIADNVAANAGVAAPRDAVTSR